MGQARSRHADWLLMCLLAPTSRSARRRARCAWWGVLASCVCTRHRATSSWATLPSSTSRPHPGTSPVATFRGEANISSVSGDCTVRHVGGRLEATLTSGDLRVEMCDGDVLIASTSGDVRVGRCCGTDISVRSISGDVRVGLPTRHPCRGRDLHPQRPGHAPGPGRRRTTADRRPVRLQLKTVSGDIRVERTG